MDENKNNNSNTKTIKTNVNAQSPDFKRKLVQHMLEGGGGGKSVYVHFDPRFETAVVPPQFKKQSSTVFQIGYGMPVPIPDLVLTDKGIHATLTFKRSPFTCFIPWESVYALINEESRGVTFEDAFPPEVKHEMAQDEAIKAGENVVKLHHWGAKQKQRAKDRPEPLLAKPAKNVPVFSTTEKKPAHPAWLRLVKPNEEKSEQSHH
jgi:hypothetical protein